MRYLEDFTVGEILYLDEYLVGEEEMLDFAGKYDPQGYHIDKVAAAKSEFGELIASGWHSTAIFMRMQCDSFLIDSACLSSPGVDQIRWLKPVRAGDRLRGENRVTSVRSSKSKPEMGIVKADVSIYNQYKELVMTLKTAAFFLKRPAAPDTSS